VLYKIIFSVLTDKGLERVRTHIPYPIYVGLLTFTLAIPIITTIFVLNGSIPTFSLKQLISVFFAIIFFSLLVGGVLALFLGLLMLLGKLSGYKPYEYNWVNIDEFTAETIGDKIKGLSEKLGFETCWYEKKLGYVSVRGLELESNSSFHQADNFPIRLVYTIKRQKTGLVNCKLKLETRTITLWDTGETKRLGNLGGYFVNNKLLPNE